MREVYCPIERTLTNDLNEYTNFVPPSIKPLENEAGTEMVVRLTPVLRHLLMNRLEFAMGNVSAKSPSNIETGLGEIICKRCKLCNPEISVSDDELRIKRYGFNPESTARSAFEVKTFEPARSPEIVYPDLTELKFCVIDDRKDNLGVSEVFSNHGHQVMAIQVDRYARLPGLVMSKIIDTVCEFGAHWVVCDKGLGNIDGLLLIERLREMGIWTVLYSGEYQTRETHKVADLFIVKGDIDDKEIYKMIMEKTLEITATNSQVTNF